MIEQQTTTAAPAASAPISGDDTTYIKEIDNAIRLIAGISKDQKRPELRPLINKLLAERRTVQTMAQELEGIL